VAKLFVDAGFIVMSAFISPYRKDRDGVRQLMKDGEFIEVYVKCDLEVCEARDPKGLYKKARAGIIPEFTGISAPYEEPVKPELVIDTAADDNVYRNAMKVIQYLEENGYFQVPQDREEVAAQEG